MSRPLTIRWLAHVAELARTVSAPFDGPAAASLLAFAVHLALGGRGLTGQETSYAAVEAWPKRTRERYMAVLIGHGLVALVRPGTRASGRRRGRRAEYSLTLPIHPPPSSGDVAGENYGPGGGRLSTTPLESPATSERDSYRLCQRTSAHVALELHVTEAAAAHAGWQFVARAEPADGRGEVPS